MKKDNKGFTLIELLIVIAIILSITAIGVVSFLNISKARKQEAYEDVKEQVVTAAEQYFSSNAYYLNDLTSGTIQVGVGKLVEEDYMNTVVNPVTGNKLNICDKIVVTKEGSRVNYEYIETNDSTCDGGNVIAVREAGAPEIKLSYWSANDVLITNTVDLTKWINYKILKGDKFRIHIDVLENGNGKIANLSSSHSQNLYKSSEKFANQYFTNGVYNVTYTATNSSGKTATVTTTFKIDTTAPVVSIYGKKDTRGGAIVAEGFNDSNINKITNMYTSNTWTNNDVVVYSTVDEELSGYTNDCTDSRVTSHFKWWKRVYGTWEGEFKFTCKATDGAGNVSEEANFIVKRDITAPVVSLYARYDDRGKTIKDLTSDNITSKIDPLSFYINNTWTNKDVVVYAMVDEKLSGYKNVCTDSRGGGYADFSWWRRVFNTYEGVVDFNCTATDGAGNVSKKAIMIVKRDITPPVLTKIDNGKICSSGNCYHLDHPGSKKDNSYYYRHIANFSDNLSGLPSNQMYYNHCYKDETDEDSNIYCQGNNTFGVYNGGYADRTASTLESDSSEKKYRLYQYYTFKNGLDNWYYLYYKLTDVANNTSYYMYKLCYNTLNSYKKCGSINLKPSSYSFEQIYP